MQIKIKKNVLILSGLFVIIILTLAFCLRRIWLRPKEEARAKVAIVIDDWGYNLRYLNFLKQIDIPLTVSILPNLRYSSKIAGLARRLDKKVILHLPLEPEKKGRNIGLEEHTITSNMSEEEVIENFRVALTSVPYACGVSNHMGSRATKDARLMSVIFAELKKRRLFFLDNLVTDKSICKQLAAKMKIKFVGRDFFLDNTDNYEYIEEQFKKLTEFAKGTGQAVGIAHARPATLKVLRDMIPSMQAEGIEFVFVSGLAE
ncbi:MAG: divergent polysaccharide deacetylase family protein [Candidatus Omnitrophica bacterium]|nr:divergent polysaccharide deacetylase family protein [Candidatus Omnitrophota bacterium]MBU4141135.1 divergent polysaccharide deacetylase family protein [Candidatus Omnitrophota bacterium]